MGSLHLDAAQDGYGWLHWVYRTERTMVMGSSLVYGDGWLRWFSRTALQVVCALPASSAKNRRGCGCRLADSQHFPIANGGSAHPKRLITKDVLFITNPCSAGINGEITPLAHSTIKARRQPEEEEIRQTTLLGVSLVFPKYYIEKNKRDK